MTERVSDEAVEVAAKAMYGKHWDGPPEKMPGERMKDVWRDYSRRALSAAAPLIVAGEKVDERALKMASEAAVAIFHGTPPKGEQPCRLCAKHSRELIETYFAAICADKGGE